MNTNRHLNVWLEDLVEEPLNAGEDKSRNEKDVREVESELSYHESLLFQALFQSYSKIGWKITTIVIMSHRVHYVCKRFWPTTRGGQGGLHCLACPHIALPGDISHKGFWWESWR